MAEVTADGGITAVPAETPTVHRTQGELVADILAGGAAPPAETPPETGAQADPEPSESWELKAVAEKLGTEPETLYEQLKVALADGQEITVSALKDAYKPVAELEKARAGLLEEMTGSKREVLQTQQEFSALLQMLGPERLTPEVLRAVNQMADQQREQQLAGMLSRIPEWKDPITKAADWVDIRRVGKEYGFSDAEMRLAEQGFADHRLIAMARALGKQPKVETPKPAPKVAVQPKAGKVQSKAQQLGNLKAAVTKGQITQADAVRRILGG